MLGATNRPDSLDPALRRAGRFDREVCLGIPDKDARAAILAVHTAKVTLSPDVSLQKIASLTPGFVGADLVALIREAAMAAVNRWAAFLVPWMPFAVCCIHPKIALIFFVFYRTFDELKKKLSAEEVIPSKQTAAAAAAAVPSEVKVVESAQEKPISVVEPEVTDIVIEEEEPPIGSPEKTDVVEMAEKQPEGKPLQLSTPSIELFQTNRPGRGQTGHFLLNYFSFA